jgi:16S rRNA (guanine966-N2)-methyltransferase
MRRAAKSATSQLRIIGGQWRGQKLAFPDRPGLRPTGDRVRETLFNWVGHTLPGAKCLDLFAGSGALGIEALSRGAAHCDFIDTDREAVASIDRYLERLGAQDVGATHCHTASEFLGATHSVWDIVFVDPPFDARVGEATLTLLLTGGHITLDSWVYFETSRSNPEAVPETHYEIFREKTAGDVRYQLLKPRSA